MTDDGRQMTDDRRRKTEDGRRSSVSGHQSFFLGHQSFFFGLRSPVIGHSSSVFFTGQIARGLDDQEIDFVLIGDEIDKDFLVTLIEKVEKLIKRKVKCFILRDNEEKEYLTGFPEALLLWESHT